MLYSPFATKSLPIILETKEDLDFYIRNDMPESTFGNIRFLLNEFKQFGYVEIE